MACGTQSTHTDMKKFPELKAQLLSGKQINLPGDLKGKRVFLSIAFDNNGEYRPQQKQCDEWLIFWKDSLSEEGIDYYEIPMMSGKYWIISFFINGGMRNGIDPSMHDNVACFYGNKDKYKKLLGLASYDDIVTCLLDEKGRIQTIQYGAPSIKNQKEYVKVLHPSMK